MFNTALPDACQVADPFHVIKLTNTAVDDCRRRVAAPVSERVVLYVTNAPTEAMNNLIKRIKRVGFGFTKFARYRARALLYANKPNWNLLPTITPR